MVWKKGQSGNPKGSPKTSLVSIIRAKLSEEVELKDGKKTTIAEAVIQSLFKQAVKGDMKAINTLLERIDGKVIEKIEQDFKVNGMKFIDNEGNVIDE